MRLIFGCYYDRVMNQEIEIKHLEAPGKDNIKMDLREVGWGGAWTGSIWLRIGKGGELL
jgi:hypothetical protein